MGAELEYYKEHLEHGRHTEVQRSTIAGLAATASGAIIGELLKRPKLEPSALPYTVALTFIGAVAWLLSAKLYERFQLHMKVAKRARNKLDPSLAALRTEAEIEQKKEFPILFQMPLHLVWSFLFGAFAAIGVITTIICLCHK